MKYSIEEAWEKISERSRRLLLARSRRKAGLLAISCVLVVAALIMAVYGYAKPPTAGSITGDVYSYYGAFMLPNEAGGYILVGVLSFAVAVVMTLICLRFRDRNKSSTKDMEKADNN